MGILSMKIIKTLQAKTVKICLLAASLSVISVPAFAQNESGSYVGVGYAALDYEISGAEFSTPAMIINGGYKFNPYFALEGRLGLGLDDDTIGGLTAEIDNYFGGFVRVGYPVHQLLNPYAMLGYGQSKVSISNASASTSISDDDSDFAYGIGASIGFSDSVFAKIEYMNYYDENPGTGDVKGSGVTFGLEATF